ncbi:MAG: hypothetical protein QXR87_07060, partial [Candidatus Hadarchaeales archaeon]
ELCYVISNKGNFAVASLKIGETILLAVGTLTSDKYSFTKVESPTLFRRYPLWGTRGLGISILIHHPFEVERDRSGPIFNEKAREALKVALENVPEFLRFLHEQGWENLERAAYISSQPQPEGSWNCNSSQIVEFIKSNLAKMVINLSGLPLVSLESGKISSPSQSAIPYIEGKGDLKSLWELVGKLHPNTVVRHDLAEAWREVLRGWIEVSQEKAQKFGGIDIGNIIEEIKGAKNLKGLAQRLKSDQRGALDFLKQVYLEAIQEGKRLKELKEEGILPAANEEFSKDVSLGGDVDPELFEIALKFGVLSPSKLLHPEVAGWKEFEWEQIESLRADEVEARISDKIIQTADKRQILEESARFLKWLIQKKRDEKIKDFKFVFANETKEAEEERKKPYFVPQCCWPEEAKKYKQLFDIVTLDDEYCRVLGSDDWKYLKDLGIVTSDFVIEKEEESSDELQKLISGEKWKDVADCLRDRLRDQSKVKVKKIPNLELICRVRIRKSKENSLNFLTFLLEYLIKRDNSWKQSKEIPCEKHGKPHKLRASHWFACLHPETEKGYEWVWEGTDKSSKPSAENLKKLLREPKPELLKELESEESREFLAQLGLPPGELTMAILAKSSEDEKQIGNKIFQIVYAWQGKHGMAGLDYLPKLAELRPECLQNVVKLVEEKGGEEASSILQRIVERSELLQHNRLVGRRIEESIKELLHNREKDGLRLVVEGRKVGADAAVRLEDTQDGTRIEIAEYLLEIKSTRTEEVGDITPRQAETACQWGNRYFLCVVPLSPDENPEAVDKNALLRRARMVSDVYRHLEPRYIEVRSVKTRESGEQVWVENLDGIRYAIRKEIWENEKVPTLEQWINKLLEESTQYQVKTDKMGEISAPRV